jgi:hypothetical protein
MSPSRRDVALTYGPPAAIALLVIVVQLIRFGGLYAASDDSYIYLGYVKRALQPPRALFSYNVGEHSAGTTGVLYYYALLATAVVTRAFTFFLPLATTLTVSMYALNSALFIGCAGMLMRLVQHLTDDRFIWRMAALALLLGSVKFTWGVFAGLENPLTAFLAVALVSAARARWSWVWIAVLSGLIVGARPELAPVMAIVPACLTVGAGLRQPMTLARLGGTVWRAVAATALCGAVITAIVLPCWWTTGRVFPSSFGTRVAVDALGNVDALWRGFLGFNVRLLGRTYWSLGSTILLLALVLGAPFRNLRVPLVAMAFVTLQFVTRAILKLNNFDQEDRYVSYLWPLYVLAITPLLYGAVLALRPVRTALEHPGRALVVTAVLAVAVVFGPLRELDRRFSEDVSEMNQVVVTPARWMQAHLPPGSRVAMEPAGAIRVFTDLYLLDTVGLTTDHRYQHKSLAEYIAAHRVDYVFHYPILLPELRDPSRYERLMSWVPVPTHHSLGEIGVYRPTDATPPAAAGPFK